MVTLPRSPLKRKSPMRRRGGKRSTKAGRAHMGQVRELQCIACELEKCDQPNKTEAHHCNAGGKAGNKRRGDEQTLPLCKWHHVGEPPMGMTASEAAFKFGPSLARASRSFRDAYGTDDELLAKVAARLNMTANFTNSLNQEAKCLPR